MKLQAPHEPVPEHPQRPAPPQPAPGVLVAEADLRLNEMQDLADAIANIGQAAVGFDLRFHLRLELSGSARPPEAVVAKINLLLQDISDNLRLP